MARRRTPNPNAGKTRSQKTNVVAPGLKALSRQLKYYEKQAGKDLKAITGEVAEGVHERGQDLAESIPASPVWGASRSVQERVAMSRAYRWSSGTTNAWVGLFRTHGEEIGAEFGGVKYDRFGPPPRTKAGRAAGNFLYPGADDKFVQKKLQVGFNKRFGAFKRDLHNHIKSAESTLP